MSTPDVKPVQLQITNYDGSIAVSPKQLVAPKSVEEIQRIVRDKVTYPSPVRAMGSFHSLTPCAASDGTIVDMKQLNAIVSIDPAGMKITAQAGLQLIEASLALRKQNLQFMLNIEIGNMTLGSGACCHTKDGLDGIELGQVCSYVTAMKWVTASGDLQEASETDNPDLLRVMRTSYGLMGIIYEVTFRIKPIEAVHFTYLPRPVDELTQAEVDQILAESEGLVCWAVNRKAVFQQRHKIEHAGILGSLQAAARRRLWNFGGAFVGHIIDKFLTDKDVRDAVERGNLDLEGFMYDTLHLAGGITLLAPDKTIDYRETPPEARYAFTFWAFPQKNWVSIYKEYLDWADQYHARTGFRCNLPLGAYRVRRDDSSLLSYSTDGDVFSIDPIHAPTDAEAWADFLKAFNEFASPRGGIPLLNQSPFVTREQVQKAFGERWTMFSKLVREADPDGRLLNRFFADLLSAG
jgi:FAD/FMN-containing dehydrogenase